MLNRKILTKFIPILALGMFIIAGLVYGWVNRQNWEHYFQLSEKDKDLSTAPITSQNNVESKDDLTKDWKVYRNEKYGFEVRYPKDWEISATEGVECEVSAEAKENIVEECTYQIRGGWEQDFEYEKPPTGTFDIGVYSNPKNLDPESFASLREYPPKDWITSESAYYFKNQPTFEVIINNTGNKRVFVSLPRKSIILLVEFPIAVGKYYGTGDLEYVRYHSLIFDSLTFFE